MFESMKAIPYRLWASPEKRTAAPPVATRQCKRNLLFRAAFDTFTRMYPGPAPHDGANVGEKPLEGTAARR